MKQNLFDFVTDWMYHQQRKHGFEKDYSEQLVNQMTQWEFLQTLSDYLEQCGVNDEKQI